MTTNSQKNHGNFRDGKKLFLQQKNVEIGESERTNCLHIMATHGCDYAKVG